jgi:predicted phosphodiesterase
MRYAFVSDLHANLQAWRAVHRDIRSLHADYIICLGDVVGYGPSPSALLNEVHAHVDAFVMGNHDAVISGKMDDSSFTPEAREIIRWTAGKLDAKASAFLGSFPLTLVGNGFRCAHGDFARPASFEYVLNPEDALPSWQANDAPLLFTGHTHHPAFFLIGASGTPRETEPQDFELERGKRYFINVGSVGQPRTGDPRASYCLYDTQANAVFWRRVAFDLDSFRTTLIQSGLDPSRCQFLQNDPLAKTVPVRELLDFTPPTLPGKEAQTSQETRGIPPLNHKRHRRKAMILTAVVTLLLAAVAAACFWPRHKSTKRKASPRSTQLESPTGQDQAKKSKTGSRKKKPSPPLTLDREQDHRRDGSIAVPPGHPGSPAK